MAFAVDNYSRYLLYRKYENQYCQMADKAHALCGYGYYRRKRKLIRIRRALVSASRCELAVQLRNRYNAFVRSVLGALL